MANNEEEFTFIAVQLFNQLPDPTIIVDEQGIIRFLSDQAELLFGYHRSELVGKPISLLVPDELRQKHDEHLSAWFNQPQVRPMGYGLIVKGRRKSGVSVRVEINLSPMSTPYGMRGIATIRRRGENIEIATNPL